MSLIKNKRRRENLEFISGVIILTLFAYLIISIYLGAQYVNT